LKVQRSDGNAFFAVEICNALVEHQYVEVDTKIKRMGLNEKKVKGILPNSVSCLLTVQRYFSN
jgi:hypothetical protein